MACPADPSSGPGKPTKSTKPADTSQPPSDVENPFVAFRRFADSQVSSLLQSVIGLPSLFSPPDSKRRWKDVDDSMAKRAEALTRAQQELMDELWHEFETSDRQGNARLLRRAEEMRRWGALLSEGGRDTGNNKDIPGSEPPKNKQERLGWDGKVRGISGTHLNDQTKKDRAERFLMPTSAGAVGLKRVVDQADEGQGFSVAKDESRLNYNMVTCQDPFLDPGQAVSWLLTDDYSPLYLDRSLPYKLCPSWFKTDANDSYFSRDCQPEDLYPLFDTEQIQRHDPRLAHMINWRAAFHDLLDVHHKGILPASSHPKSNLAPVSTNPGYWISSLVNNGSLGSQWRTTSIPGSATQPFRFRYRNESRIWSTPSSFGQLFMRDDKDKIPLCRFGQYEAKNDSFPLIRAMSISADTVNDVRDQPRGSRQERPQKELADDLLWRYPLPIFVREAILDRFEPLLEHSEVGDDVLDIITAIFDERHQSPKRLEESFSSLDRLWDKYCANEEVTTSREHADSHMNRFDGTEAERSTPVEFQSSDAASSHISSSLSSSLKYESNDAQPPDSIVSTLTTLETRTLPDGKTETKRVMKTRFADGREESTESSETEFDRRDRQHPSSSLHSNVDRTRSRDARLVQQAPLTDLPLLENEIDEKKKKGKNERAGWFWN